MRSSSSSVSINEAQQQRFFYNLHTAMPKNRRTTMLFPRRQRILWRPKSTAVAAAATAAALAVAMAMCVSVAAAFHLSLPFISPTQSQRQPCYSSSSTFIQAVAEQEVLLKTLPSSSSSRQRQRQRQKRSSLQNRNQLERLYSLPVVDYRPPDKQDEFRFMEIPESQQQQMTMTTPRRMKLKKQAPTTTTATVTASSSSAPLPSLVKVVKGRKMDNTRMRPSTKISTPPQPLAKKTRSSMSMKQSDAATVTAAAATATATASRTASTAAAAASTFEDDNAAPSSSTVQFKGLSTTSYRGNRKLPLPTAASAAFKKPRPTITSNTTMTMAAGDSSTTKTPTTISRTRSSTMPGMAVPSDNQRAFRDGIRVAEQESGRKFVDTLELSASRRRTNGENMYKNSASVPDSLMQFANEIHQQGRISAQEEIALGTTVQEAIRLQRHLDALRLDLSREPTDAEWCAAAGKINMQAIREAIDEGLEAKNKLVTSNLRMVQSVVNTYIRNGLSAQYNAGDLMQEGILALIRAAEKFEPDRGWKFSTYAMYWVRASVKRNQIYQSRVITVPQRLYESHKRLQRVGQELQVTLERKPTHQELGDAVGGMTAEQVKRCFIAMEQRCFSLDQEVSNSKKPLTHDGNKNRLVDIMDCKSPDDDAQRMQFIREDIIETLHRQLSPEEVELLLFRYGLKELPGSNNSKKKKTLGSQPTIAELSRAVGLKPDKVRRIINRALHQLRSVQSGEWLAFERELLR